MIFIAGPHDAGKTTIASYLRDFGFLHIETSTIVKAKHKEMAPDTNFGEWAIGQNHCFDKYIAQAVVKIEQAIKRSNGRYQDIVVTGNRQIGGINYLINEIPPLRQNLIIYVEADELTLFNRHMSRPDGAIQGLTLQRFRDEVLAYDQKMGVEKIKEAADIVICNNGEVYSCLETVFSFLQSRGYVFPNSNIEGNRRGREIE
jgi:dephospho-CoA kinase